MTAMVLAAVEDWARQVLVEVGLIPDDARVVAENLAFAEARGVASHGLLRLKTYVDRIRAGGINRHARATIDVDLGALVVLDADHGPGASVGVYASDLAAARGKELGIGCVVAKNANHFGAAGFFANRIADAGLVGMVACNTESVMCAPGGGRPVLGTNPLAVAVPLPRERRPQLDMATTIASQGKLISAAQEGRSIPPGWAVDAEGRPTTSPARGLEGALLPSGGPKGFGLAFVIDALVASAGACVSTEVSPLAGDPATPQRVGQLYMAIRADAGLTVDGYRDNVQALVDAIHASAIDGMPTAPLAPGEPELQRERAGAGFVELPPALLDMLAGLAAETGVAFPPVGALI